MVLGKINTRSRAKAAYFVDQIETRSTQQTVKLVTQFFAPDYAATGQLLDELVRQLARQGLPVEVFTGQPAYADDVAEAPQLERSNNLKIRRSRVSQLWSGRIRGKALTGLLFAIRAFLHLLRHGFDKDKVLLLTTAPPFLPVVGYLMSLLFNTPYVVILYDLYPDIAVELGVVDYHHPVAKFWRWLNQRVWRRAKSLIVLSPSLKERVVGHCPDIADRVEVIHSWADPELIRPIEKKDNWFARKHGLVDTFTVLYSGNMGRCHDIETIFEAAKLLRNEPIRFVCIGGGAKREKLIEDVAAEGLENFLFLPYQDKKDIPYSMTACDVSLVSVSEGMESLVAPSKLYPALAAGRPIAIICPEGTYLESLIKDNRCGSTFRNSDSQGLAGFLKLLAYDAGLVQDVGYEGRQMLESKFTPTLIAKAYRQLLTRV
ncbi:glycosyltransferase family 4 protein [Leptolyngbya cf. ectocarpi LEGE 11479]|uniref:Glycosyltransferase family 4 protein n=1 Tax=Leptolyngbya cf. ectocarpi LEGE 11479 TaxID=1828722 RepID=A0A928ZWQ0_LEPEC|nr:glycosyltransferase family 4 protein [Leptolyngbya ectocarpi]MBE9068847.1 glycosyltransferase family 4 protein [Leptolyngbya cf. ectocarpi LEGE 11479]